MNDALTELWRRVQELTLAAGVTLHEAGAWLYRVYFLPGDWLLSVLIVEAPPVARFLGLGAADYGGVLSGFLSGLLWLAAVIVLGTAYSFVREVDRAATARLAESYREARRLTRIGRRRFAIAVRSLRQWRRTKPATTEVVESALEEMELSVLACFSDSEAGYVLTGRDVAASLGTGRREIMKTLAHLKKLRLLESALGTSDGEEAFRITVTGKAYVDAYRGMPPPSESRRRGSHTASV
jgi:hypothetical protein